MLSMIDLASILNTHSRLIHYLVEFVLLILVIYLYYIKSFTRNTYKRPELTKKEKEKLIEEWNPEPLVPKDFEPPRQVTDSITTLKVYGKYIDLKMGNKSDTVIKCIINLCTMNQYCFIGDKKIENELAEVVKVCGVGSCGPRSFFGTNKHHLDLEECVSKFLGTEKSILLSYGFSTISSAIPSYAKITDIIFFDEGCAMPIQVGCKLSRSKCYSFKHNDLDDLEAVINNVFDEIKKESMKKFLNTKFFIVVESIYTNYGDIVDLKRLIEIKYKYKIRIFIDETFSLGILGRTGRGLCEYYNVSIKEVDMISASLESAIGTPGGICTGSNYVIERQTLSSSAYCFSASQSSGFAKAAAVAFDVIDKTPDMVSKLNKISEEFYAKLKESLPLEYFIDGFPQSPFFHIRKLAPCDTLLLHKKETEFFDDVRNKLILDHKIAVSSCKYIRNKEFKLPKPSLRVFMNIDLTSEDITDCVSNICKTLVTCESLASI